MIRPAGWSKLPAATHRATVARVGAQLRALSVAIDAVQDANPAIVAAFNAWQGAPLGTSERVELHEAWQIARDGDPVVGELLAVFRNAAELETAARFAAEDAEAREAAGAAGGAK